MILYFFCTKMAANGGKEYSAICSMIIILCLLCSMSCATTLKTDSHNQSSSNFTSSSLQSFSSGTINADGGTTVKEPSSCDTTLENKPKNKTRYEGQRVSLICNLIDEYNGGLAWVYLSGPGKRRFISVNDHIYHYEGQDKNNYKVVIDESLQTYKLIIKAATFPTDSGTYQCRYHCNSTNYVPLASAVVTILPKLNPSPICHMNLLPSLQSEADGDTFEIICFWAHGYEGNAHFQNANREDVQIHLTFPDHIISRIKASKVPNIVCHLNMYGNSSETVNVPCIGNERTGMLRVDPFINEVTVNSNATFECAFSNHSYSYSGYWKIHYGANSSLVRQENLIENQKVISIVNVSESHQSILVECALSVSDNEKISSFGALRIVRMTTVPPDENPTQWTTNNISITTTNSSESRPSTITMLPEATSIRVPSPQVSVPTTTVSKSVMPITSRRMLTEGSSISVTPPLTSVATTTTDISESTRSTTAIRMLSETTTITVTTSRTLVPTTPSTGTPQIFGAPICKMYTLPDVREDYLNRDYEIVCSWNHSQAYQAQLQRSNGETIDNFLTFPDHIISRVNSSESKSINCQLSLNNNTSSAEINTSCVLESNIPSFIRVDPFVTHVDEGSSALFTCTFNHQSRKSWLSWKVHSSGNLSAVDLEKSTEDPNVNFTIHEQKDGEYLIVECQLHGNRNMSSYGLLRITEGTTISLSTTSGEDPTSQITDSHLVQTVKSTTNQNDIIETRPPVKMTTKKIPTSSEEDQTTPSSKKGLVVMISISVLVAAIILLLSLAIVYLLRKQKRISLPRRLSEEGKTDTIELSNIPHILHEESSEWYALSFKDKRVQDMQGQQSNDLIVKDHDESDQSIPMLPSSLGIPSLHPLESIDENVYAEPDISEEPIRQTISRQQCTFTPLLEDDQ